MRPCFAIVTGGAPPSYFDVPWDEQEDAIYAPIAGGDAAAAGGRGGGTPFGDGGAAAAATATATAAAAAAAPTRDGGADAACATVAAEGGGGGRGGGPVTRWPALAEEHLVRLYSNDDGCRDRWVGGSVGGSVGGGVDSAARGVVESTVCSWFIAAEKDRPVVQMWEVGMFMWAAGRRCTSERTTIENNTFHVLCLGFIWVMSKRRTAAVLVPCLYYTRRQRSKR